MFFDVTTPHYNVIKSKIKMLRCVCNTYFYILQIPEPVYRSICIFFHSAFMSIEYTTTHTHKYIHVHYSYSLLLNSVIPSVEEWNGERRERECRELSRRSALVLERSSRSVARALA